jgi:hypothetical protein
MANDGTTEGASYGISMYEPSILAAIVAAGMFAAGGLVHVLVMCRKKTWFYMPLVIGAFSTF